MKGRKSTYLRIDLPFLGSAKGGVEETADESNKVPVTSIVLM
jgi:hypothetical protein